MAFVAVMDPDEHVQQPRGRELARGGFEHAVHGWRGERLQSRGEAELRDRIFVREADLLETAQQRRIDDDVQQPCFEEHLLCAGAILWQVVVCDVDLFRHVTRGGIRRFPRRTRRGYFSDEEETAEETRVASGLCHTLSRVKPRESRR